MGMGIGRGRGRGTVIGIGTVNVMVVVMIITCTQKRYQLTNYTNIIVNVKTSSLPVNDISRDLLKKNLNCILLITIL